MHRIPGGIHYTPDDVGFNALVIANGVTTSGNTLAWRAAFAFDTVVARINVVAGAANFIPRIDWVDFDGVTPLISNQPFLNPGSTNTVWYYWAKTETARSLGGTVANNTLPAILGAPFAILKISNSDAAPATFTFEVMLLRGSD